MAKIAIRPIATRQRIYRTINGICRDRALQRAIRALPTSGPFNADNLTSNVHLPFLLRSVGLNMNDLFSAVKTLFPHGIGRKIDHIEISDAGEIHDAAGKVTMKEDVNPLDQSERTCLVIPRQVLISDPNLVRPNPHFSQENLSAIFIDQAFAHERTVPDRGESGPLKEVWESLTRREADVIKMHFGFNEKRRGYTYKEIGERFQMTRDRAREMVVKTLRKLRHPLRSGVITTWQKNYSGKLAELLKDKFVVSLDELEWPLIQAGLLAENEKGLLLSIIYLCREVTRSHLDEGVLPEEQRDSIFLNLTNGRDRARVEMVFCRDYAAYSKIVAYWTERKTTEAMSIEDYQSYLSKEEDIRVPYDDLVRILVAHNMIDVRDGVVASNLRQHTKYQVKRLLAERGPLHYSVIGREIASSLPVKEGTIINMLGQNDNFVQIGVGIYDLATNHPGLRDITYPKGIRRKSAVFAAIYVILSGYRSGSKFLSVREIHEEMKRRGFFWTQDAINMIVNHDNYRAFFEVTTDNKFGLADMET